jgi:hypothetical protein
MDQSPRTAAASVDEMPLDELRTRARDVHDLLRSAREDVDAALAEPSASAVESCVARLLEALANVRALLPGLTLLSPDSRRRLALDAGPPPGDDVPSIEDARAAHPAPHTLNDVEIARAKEILAEMKDGIERIELLGGVADSVEELVVAIEAGRQRARI